MNDNLPRRNVLASVLAALPLPTGSALAAMPAPILCGDDAARLPDHAALWARMPLPFTPAEAWHLLSPATQAEIGAAVIGMALADYVSGHMHEEVDHFRDDALRSDCMAARDKTMNALDDRLWVLFPDLYGPEDDHPAWALEGGFAS